MQKKLRLSPLDSLLDESGRRQFADFLLDRADATDSALDEFKQKWKVYEKQMDDDFTWRGNGQGTRDHALEKRLSWKD